MKILMIGTNLRGQGGITSVINTYLNSEVFKKNEIIYLTAHSGRNIFFKIIKFIIALIKLPFLLLNGRIKIVHIHVAQKMSFYRKSIFLLVSKLFGKKIIFHIHAGRFKTFYNESSGLGKKYIRKILNYSDLILVVSNSLKNEINTILDNKHKIVVLYNPIVIENTIKNSKIDDIKLVFFGKICKNKGVYNLVDAISIIRSKKYVLLICGDGELEKIRNIVHEKKLGGVINFPGWVVGNQKKEILQNADVFVLPSYTEGLPMSILEAMTYRLPVVSTTVGGIPEVVEHGKTGFLVKPGDVKNLSKYLNLLISDKALREKMGAEGYKKAKNTFDVKIIVKRLNEIYKSVEKGEK